MANTFKSKIVPSYNIIFVGKSGVGKTALIRTLIDPSTVVQTTVWAQTKEAKVHPVTFYTAEGPACTMNLIDVPGVFEVVEVGATKRSDVEILKLCETFVKENIATVHMLCFVYPLQSITQEDVRAFRVWKQVFGEEFAPISYIAFSHCETKTPERALLLMENLKKVKDTQPLWEFCENRQLFLGAVDEDQAGDGAELFRNRISDMRATFIETVMKLPNNAGVRDESIAKAQASAMHAATKEMSVVLAKKIRSVSDGSCSIS